MRLSVNSTTYTIITNFIMEKHYYVPMKFFYLFSLYLFSFINLDIYFYILNIFDNINL